MTLQRRSAERVLRELGLVERPGIPTFDEFTRQWLPPEFLLQMFQFDGGKQGTVTTAMVELFYPILVALKTGDVVMKVTPDLITSLRDTEIPDLPVEMLKTPFEAFRVSIPAKTFAAPADQVREIHIANATVDRFRVVFSVGVDTHYINILTSDPECRIDEAIDFTMKAAVESVPKDLLQQLKDSAAYDDYFKTDVFRFAANLSLYITCPDADMYRDDRKQRELHRKLQGMKGGRRRDALLRKLVQEKQRNVYIVGANIRLSKEYTAELTETGKHWVLKHRVRVMGHWRQQPYGPERSLRKPKWISPHWRGPTYAEMVEKGYVVK